MKEKIITVIGSLNFDIIFKQQRLAVIGETYSADNMTITAGGKGANQAVQCAKLGAPTYLVGSVGRDVLGDQLLQDLADYGVNTDYVTRVDATTGVGVVNALEDGALMSTISKGANYAMTTERIDEIESLLKRSSIVILQLEIPIEVVEYCIHKAHDLGCFVILNAAPAAAISVDALAKVNCLVVNEPEATFYCGELIDDLESALKCGRELYEKTGELLIITLGKIGSVLFDAASHVHVKATEVEAIETTGAGDSYIGAFACQLLDGKEIAAAAGYATRAAAITVTKIGGQPAMPTLRELEMPVPNETGHMV
ncbi:carbohydrate kinase [Paenibacillus sp. Leaf72]|nr:carbohydrate kinase [Paenibacillus sp. Leaf72]